MLPTGIKMQQLLRNQTAYEEMLAWKTEGPQDSFLALVDLNAVSTELTKKIFHCESFPQSQFSLSCCLLPC